MKTYQEKQQIYVLTYSNSVSQFLWVGVSVFRAKWMRIYTYPNQVFFVRHVTEEC